MCSRSYQSPSASSGTPILTAPPRRSTPLTYGTRTTFSRPKLRHTERPDMARSMHVPPEPVTAVPWPASLPFRACARQPGQRGTAMCNRTRAIFGIRISLLVWGGYVHSRGPRIANAFNANGHASRQRVRLIAPYGCGRYFRRRPEGNQIVRAKRTHRSRSSAGASTTGASIETGADSCRRNR